MNTLEYSPLFSPEPYSEEDRKLLSPFFTNLDKSVYVPLMLSPELIGALCSRTSRAKEDLRTIFFNEYLKPFLKPVREATDTEDSWSQKVAYGRSLKEFIEFLHSHPAEELFSNPRARSFYTKWLAQYGDDSIAQMTGAHLVFSGISQVAIKHFEDQRIGLAPIEKSTRYVNYANKVNGHYLYYTDPTLKELGLLEQYKRVMDHLFETNAQLIPRLTDWLTQKFPEEKLGVIEKKAFDTLRELLPTSTISQVAFFGNGQSFEYAINRSMKHTLGEIRWAAEKAYEELSHVIPSLLRRVKDSEKQDVVEQYQTYLSQKQNRVVRFCPTPPLSPKPLGGSPTKSEVTLVEFDSEGEDKIIAGILYSASNNHSSWVDTQLAVSNMPQDQKKQILEAYLQGRDQRWQKIGRAFENTFVRFEIVTNIGAWRDIHRHRMLTQQRQLFTVLHGYDIPPEIIESGLEQAFRDAIDPVADLHQTIAKTSPELAQYCVTLAHRIRFMQWENLRQSFWQIELRSIPEGHPDYRHVVQKKYKLLEAIYPLLSEHILVNMGEYDFARRGQEEKIQRKEQRIV